MKYVNISIIEIYKSSVFVLFNYYLLRVNIMQLRFMCETVKWN